MTDSPLTHDTNEEILNPEATYERSGEDELRNRLTELSRDALERVVETYPPHHTAPPALDALSDHELVSYIVDGAKRSAAED